MQLGLPQFVLVFHGNPALCNTQQGYSPRWARSGRSVRVAGVVLRPRRMTSRLRPPTYCLPALTWRAPAPSWRPCPPSRFARAPAGCALPPAWRPRPLIKRPSALTGRPRPPGRSLLPMSRVLPASTHLQTITGAHQPAQGVSHPQTFARTLLAMPVRPILGSWFPARRQKRSAGAHAPPENISAQPGNLFRLREKLSMAIQVSF
jgi:hypothetical protein